jgi:hypothetical protein
MSVDGGAAERARALLERCGIATSGMEPEQAVRRADEVAAAAAAHCAEQGQADAAAFDAHMAAEFEQRDLDARWRRWWPSPTSTTSPS